MIGKSVSKKGKALFDRFVCAVAFLLLGLVFGCNDTGQSSGLKELRFAGGTMGTSYQITCLVPHDFEMEPEEVEKKISQTLSLVNQQMSAYDRNSLLSRLNAHEDAEAFEVPESLAKVLDEAISLNKMTQGGLDITMGPLVNLWGFGTGGKRDIIPDSAEIASSMEKTGIDKIMVTESDGRYFVRKKIPDISLDLASIAKGFGVDQVADLLESLKMEHFLVEIGGEIRCRGKNSRKEPWRVGIEKPDIKGKRIVEKVVSLTDMGMATSGDYRNYFEQNGKRFSHVIDPETGRPIAHHLASISVVHPSCMTADGLATGLFVLGPEKAMQIAEKQNFAVYLIIRTGEGFEGKSSSAFERLLQ